MTHRRRIVLGIALTVLILSGVYGLFAVSRSRTFQFFGGLTSRVGTSERMVALTFDDAPGAHADDVIAVLRQKTAPATAYVIGASLAQYPDAGTRLAAAGLELGNHTYSHRRMVLVTPGFVVAELTKTDAVIRQTGYTGPITFRPPNGKKLLVLPWYLSRHGTATIMWDVEPDTYAGTRTGTAREDFLVDYTLSHVRAGSIILLHPFCGTACDADRNALPRIIDGLRSRGYTLVTVSQLLSRAGK